MSGLWEQLRVTQNRTSRPPHQNQEIQTNRFYRQVDSIFHISGWTGKFMLKFKLWWENGKQQKFWINDQKLWDFIEMKLEISKILIALKKKKAHWMVNSLLDPRSEEKPRKVLNISQNSSKQVSNKAGFLLALSPCQQVSWKHNEFHPTEEYFLWSQSLGVYKLQKHTRIRELRRKKRTPSSFIVKRNMQSHSIIALKSNHNRRKQEDEKSLITWNNLLRKTSNQTSMGILKSKWKKKEKK